MRNVNKTGIVWNAGQPTILRVSYPFGKGWAGRTNQYKLWSFGKAYYRKIIWIHTELYAE